MAPKALLAIVAILCAARAQAASKLDAPIEQQRPTVRSEIYRGISAHSNTCGIDASRQLDCVFAIQNANVQRNTSTDAFNAGVFFGAWLISATHEDAVREASHQEVHTDALRFYRSMKGYQEKLGIDDAALCEATRVVCRNVVPLMREWDRRVQ